MKRFLVALTVALILAAAPVLAQPGAIASWVEGTIIGVPTDNSKTTLIYVGALGENPAEQIPQMALLPSQWHTITFAHLHPQYAVPSDVKAVFLSGTLVSSGGPPVYCSMVLSFRAPGSVLNEWNYQGAAVSSLPGGGFRQNLALWVPVVNGAFQFWWFYSNPECPMIINLSLQAYVR